MVITEGKQVGTLYHFTTEVTTLCSILHEEALKASKNTERTYSNKERRSFVSFTRDKLAPSRNNNKWSCGIIIDGDKLSDKYHIEPYSWAGNSIERGAGMRLLSILKYDDGVCTASFLKMGTSEISSSLYDKLKKIMFDRRDKFDFVELGSAKISRNGHKRIEGYRYISMYGGVTLSSKLMGNDFSLITKSDRFNEKEERIWLSSETDFVDLRGCIKGVVLAESAYSSFDADDPVFVWLYEECEKLFGSKWEETSLILI